jgi:ABC-2 type transport system permease protein
MAVRHAGWEQRSYWRTPAAALFTFALPLVLLAMFTSTFGNQRIDQLGGIRQAQYYLPSILAYGVMSASFVNLAIALATQRDLGLLRRIRVAPLPTSAFFLGTVLHVLVVCTAMVVLALGFGVFAFGTSLEAAKVPALVVSTLLAVPVYAALGIAVSGLVPNADAAPAVVNLPYLVLTFTSGGFFPVSGTFADVTRWLPLRPLVNALFRCFDPRVTGAGWAPADLAILAGWGALGLLVAVRSFRWERPR